MEPLITNSEEKKPNFLKELGTLLLLAVFVVIPFRMFVAQPFIVDGASMDPTFHTGQYLIVDELTYHFRAPFRGSVIIFKYPKDTSKYFIKRVVGLPGETVVLADGKVTIKNTEHPKGFVLDDSFVTLPKVDNATYVMQPDEYFVLGDNRAESADSRFWGPLPTKDIIGRPILRAHPLDFWPGDKTELEKNAEINS